MKTLLITGSSGFLGQRLIQQWQAHCTLHLPTRQEMNLTDAVSVQTYFAQKNPDYVLHLAAITQTQACEDNPEQAYAINVEGTKNIAIACKSVQAKLLFFSTEQVFNGNPECGPYDENCLPLPNTVYGKTKWEAEQLLPTIFNDFWILRLTWLFDRPKSPLLTQPSDILGLTIRNIQSNLPTHAATNEYRGMTSVWEVIKNIPKVWALPYGLHHFGSANDLSRATIVTLIHSLYQQNNPAATTPDPHYVTHPIARDIRLACHKIAQAGIIFTPTAQAIEEIMQHNRL